VENLAGRYSAAVVFLQVVDPVPLAIGYETSYAALRQDFERRTQEAESYLAGLQGTFREKGIQARTHVMSGPVVDAIIKVAEREGADLIALASHGRTGLSQVFYGSVAAGVLHRIDRPLLLIRSRDDE
jgi:nucleotide-binding universal stress UspA family protein